MTEKICVSCSMKNQPHFTYCKYCGAILPVVDKVQKESLPQPDDIYSFGEVSCFEFHRYIGSGAENLLDDFKQLDQGRRFVFSLPVLFLGIFFGFYGMSAWFFYRKLKKPALILLGVGVLLTLLDTVLNASLNRMLIDELFNILGSNPDVSSLISSLSGLFSYYSYSLIDISSYISFFTSFFVAANALKIFKNKAYKSILAIKASFEEGASLPLDAMLKNGGGVSLGTAVLPFAVSALLPIIAFAVTVI